MIDLFCQYSSIPMLVLEASGKVLQHNEAFTSFGNAAIDRLYGSSGYQLLSDTNFAPPEIKRRISEALQGRFVQIELETYQFPTEFSAVPESPPLPHPIKIVIFPIPQVSETRQFAMLFIDQSYQHEDTDLVRRCEALKSLARSVVEIKHEINNPLLLIIGHTQLLLAKQDKLPADVANKLTKILSAAEKIRQIAQEHRQLAEKLSRAEFCEMP